MNPDLNEKLQKAKKKLEEENLKEILKNRVKKRKEIHKAQDLTPSTNPAVKYSSTSRFLEKPFQRNPFSRTSSQNYLSQKVIYKSMSKGLTEKTFELPKPPQWKPEEKKRL